MFILEAPVDKSSSVSTDITTKYKVKNTIIYIKISSCWLLEYHPEAGIKNNFKEKANVLSDSLVNLYGSYRGNSETVSKPVKHSL